MNKPKLLDYRSVILVNKKVLLEFAKLATALSKQKLDLRQHYAHYTSGERKALFPLNKN
jgi:hypothetical protein